MENRSHKGTVEVRAGANGPVLVGYAAVFNRDSSDLGFIEQVDPRAFDKTVREADVRGLGNHDVNWLLGRSKASTLRLSVDSIGLQYEIDVNEADPDGVRALQKVKRGDWDGSSFSFQAIRDEWNWEANPPQRRLLEVALIDVGPVTFPAYPDATATSRALEPIAVRCGRPVDELVTALRSGEIRSLVAPDVLSTPPPPEDAALVAVFDETLSELRAGKKLSAASMAKIRAAMDNLRDLIGADDDGADDETLLDQELESDSVNAAKEKDAAEPNAEKRLSFDEIEIEMRLRELSAAA